MSQDTHMCRDCGAIVPLGERECPSCGRLFVDRKTARFGSGAQREASQTSIDESISDSSKDEKGNPPGSGGSETDSHYSIAPIYDEPEGEEEPEEDMYQGPPQETPSMCNCAVFLFILLPLLIVVMFA